MPRAADALHEQYIKRILDIKYQFCHYKKFDYNILKYIWVYTGNGAGARTRFNDVIIMFDTETSKKVPDEIYFEKHKGKTVTKYKTHPNHVVCWTISIRAQHHNIVTLYGRKPTKLVECMIKIASAMNGEKTIFYAHNMPYDYYFIRQYLFNYLDTPSYQLNVKPHYPIELCFDLYGIIIKDSYILAQRGLEKWADDLNAEHKKAVGAWDYNKLRSQLTPLTGTEPEYIEHDTLAGVECIDILSERLGKKVYQLPLTATGIVREKARHAGGRKAHQEFLKMAPTLAQYEKLTKCYHGGYTHGNRHFVNQLITEQVEAYDFMSSYPFCMLAFKFPMEKFTPIENCDKSFILDSMDDAAFMFKFIATNIHLKDYTCGMPALQASKCEKTINAVFDNGRILAANYVEIYLTEYDLKVIDDQYMFNKHICCEVEQAAKDYLPSWFTGLVWDCFVDKTMLKGGPDPVAYTLAKAIVNSLYGMCVQKNLKDDIIEDYDTGEYKTRPHTDPQAEYDEYVNKVTSILPYQWGVWVTSIAFYNLHELVKCCDTPLYCDTDSCYGIGWDQKKLNAYINYCKKNLKAGGYTCVKKDGLEYWVGTPEHDPLKDTYTEFKYMGAKRYAGRKLKDGKVYITVAGVPKEAGATCLDNNLNNFRPGFTFPGTQTGKLTHLYIPAKTPYIDDAGNETADSISLVPCDYLLDTIDVFNVEDIFYEDINMQIYDQEV